jgi:zinc protease
MFNKSVAYKCLVFISLVLLTNICLASPNIQHWETEKGTRVYFVPATELPIVDVQIIFDAGAARDGDKSGLALLTNAMLPEGAGDMDANTIAERFDNLGVQFTNSALRDMSVYKIRSLSNPKQLDPAMETLATILANATIPENAFKREKNRLLIGIEGQKQSPGAIAGKAFYKAVYGSHPYSNMPSGNEKSVKALKRQDLVDFYKKYYVSKNAVISIVGNLDRNKAAALAELLTAKLKAGEHAADLPDVAEPTKSSLTRINHPSTQTHVLVGQPGIKRGDADYFTLYVGNHILGGNGLVSRLSDEIREKRGLSYSAYSYFSPMRKPGPFQIGLQTRNDKTDEALKVLQNTVADFVKNGPTKKELEASKKNITGGFALRISSNKKLLEYIAMIGFYDLPLDYLDNFNKNIQSITLDQIKDAFKRRVHPDKMVTVIVGGTT